MAGYLILFTAQPVAAIPEKGAEDHRVFQSLGTMHGDNAHRFFIAFKQQLGVVRGGIIRSHLQQPLHDLAHSEVFAALLFLNQFEQMVDIGNGPLG